MNVSTVIAIQTQGRANLDRWVFTCRVEYSHDCSTFNRLLDADGNNQVTVSQRIPISLSKSNFDTSNVFQDV